MSTAPYAQPSLPGMKSAAGDAARSTARTAGSWTDAERRFADACYQAWNDAFTNHGTRANRTRHNTFVAVQLLRWIHGPDNDGSPKLTGHDVLIAIAAYAKDPFNREKLGGRWKGFGDWFKDCPDAVDKQLRRLNKSRGSAAPSAAAAQAKSKLDIAREWLRASGWQSCIDEARHRLTHEGKQASLTESLKIARAEALRQMDLCRNAPARWKILRATLADLDARLKLIDQFNAIDPATRKDIFTRALRACEAIKDGRERVATVLALSVEIFRRSGRLATHPLDLPQQSSV